MSALYFIKGDSAENWGAMKLTLKKNANGSRVIWQTSQDGWTCVTVREFSAWRKKHEKHNESRPTQYAADTPKAARVEPDPLGMFLDAPNPDSP
jgi:hypothetical protein